MTLDELAALLDRATAASEVFGDDAAAGYRHLAKLCHPDRFPPGTEQEKARRVFQRLGAWKEIADGKTPPVVIASPRHHYTLVRQLGFGDVADVNLAVADGVRYVLKIARTSDANRLLADEHEHLQAMIARSGDRRYREYLPRPVETFVVSGVGRGRQVSVFAYREGYHTVEAIRERYPSGLDARHLAWVFKRMLVVTGFAHACGLVHGAVLPAHAMVHAENHGLVLLDWIHAVPTGRPLRLVPAKYRDWYPGEVFQRRAAGPATDIFLAAKCLLYIAGGDPVTGRWPAAVPHEMKQFLGTCLYESPRMRPQNAWDLHEQFDELLERLFGPPKYHPLTL